MSSLESLCEDIRTNVTVWKRYRDKGGSDPSWSDGDKLIIDMPTDEIKALRDYLDTELERYQATRRKPEEPEPFPSMIVVMRTGER